MKPKSGIADAVLLAAAAAVLSACAARTPPQLTLETDAEVESARREIPAGGSPPRQIVDVKPESAGRRRSGDRLQTMLEGVVARDGRVKVVRVMRSDDRAFTDSCIRAVQQWLYEPARARDGQPVAVWTKFACSKTTR